MIRFDNGIERTIIAECMVQEYGAGAPYSLLSGIQIPLIAGYAVTVHKAQVCQSRRRI